MDWTGATSKLTDDLIKYDKNTDDLLRFMELYTVNIIEKLQLDLRG